MKLKDALLSAAAGYVVTTLPVWEVRDHMWLIGLMTALICWDAIIRIEEVRQKRKRARGAATPRRAHTLKYFNLIIEDERRICQ